MASDQIILSFVQSSLEKTGHWPDHLAWKTSSIVWLPMWGKSFSLKPVWKASLPALYICCNFFPYQAPLDTLKYQLLSGSLNVVSPPGWTRSAPSAFAHRTSAPVPLVAPAELPTGCLCLSWRRARLRRARLDAELQMWSPSHHSACWATLDTSQDVLGARAHSSVPKDFLIPRILSLLFIANYDYFCNSLKHTLLLLYF